MDTVSKAKRSAIMASVKSKNTTPERLVFSYLRKEKIYFVKHYSKVPGKPDIASPRKKLAVFIDGGFWHGWNLDKRNLPEFWLVKIRGNVTRDKKNRRKLRSMGWKVLKVWEHDLQKKPTATLSKVKNFLVGRRRDINET